MQETWVRLLGQEDTLERGRAAHSSILAWKSPRTEKPGGLQSMGWKNTAERLTLKLDHTASSHWLSLSRMIMCTFSCYSLNSPHPPLPQLCPQVCSPCLCKASAFNKLFYIETFQKCVMPFLSYYMYIVNVIIFPFYPYKHQLLFFYKIEMP